MMGSLLSCLSNEWSVPNWVMSYKLNDQLLALVWSELNEWQESWVIIEWEVELSDSWQRSWGCCWSLWWQCWSSQVKVYVEYWLKLTSKIWSGDYIKQKQGRVETWWVKFYKVINLVRNELGGKESSSEWAMSCQQGGVSMSSFGDNLRKVPRKLNDGKLCKDLNGAGATWDDACTVDWVTKN